MTRGAGGPGHGFATGADGATGGAVSMTTFAPPASVVRLPPAPMTVADTS